jgi:hypothetical protein
MIENLSSQHCRGTRVTVAEEQVKKFKRYMFPRPTWPTFLIVMYIHGA